MDKFDWILGMVATGCAIVFGYLGYQKGVKKDSYNDGNKDAGLRSDIEYIKRRTDDVLLEQKDTNKSISALTERVTRVEESAKQAHKRLDRFEKEYSEQL